MADPRIRQIKIKTGVIKRIAKEKVVYEREVEQQKNRIQKVKSESSGEEGEHLVRKQEEVLQETLMMVPECERRLVKAFADLKNILESEKELSEHEDFVAAQNALKEVEQLLPVIAGQ